MLWSLQISGSDRIIDSVRMKTWLKENGRNDRERESEVIESERIGLWILGGEER